MNNGASPDAQRGGRSPARGFGAGRAADPSPVEGGRPLVEGETAASDVGSALEERYAIYRLLARLWLWEPDASLFAVLSGPGRPLFDAFGGTLDVARTPGPDVPGALDATDRGEHDAAEPPMAERPMAENAEQWVALASEDYCRLWIGPSGHLPPYQSVWESSQLSGAAAESVAAYVERLRALRQMLRRPPVEPAEAADWVVAPAEELIATARIAAPDHLGAELLVMSDLLICEAAGVADCGAAAEFFRTHLTWPGELFAHSLQRAGTPFYRSVVAMTRQFVLCEAVTLAAAR
ncbi:MAG: hypothetical protein D6725_17940 [Planctomycetota bacterium]|nr:MAG: hypothetical protein D6725_17940 [Planctomycetota bacterium]